MNRFTKYVASVVRKIRSSDRSARQARVSNQCCLNLESMDERCLPSISPWTLVSTHELTGDSERISHETEFSKMSKMDVATTLSPISERKH